MMKMRIQFQIVVTTDNMAVTMTTEITTALEKVCSTQLHTFDELFISRI